MFVLRDEVFAGSAGGDALANPGQQTSRGAGRSDQTAGKRIREAVERSEIIVERRHHLGCEAESIQTVIFRVVRNVKQSIASADHHPVGRTIRKAKTWRPQ